jgi:hypothetical protein
MVLSYITCKNILMFTFKIITLTQDLYWNFKQNIHLTSKINFKTDLNWFISWDVVLMLVGT